MILIMSSSSDKSLVRKDRMILMILNDVVFLIIGIRCLQKLSSSEEARISISFLSRYPCPSYDFSRPPVSTDAEEH